MASFWDQGPSQDFNLGGFQPAPPGAPNDPRLTTQPQPSQQGPGGTMLPPAIAMGPNGPIDPGTGQPYQPGPGGGQREVDPIASHGVVNDPVFDNWYQQQKASGRSFEDISNQMMAQKGIPGYSYSGNAGPVPQGPLPGMGFTSGTLGNGGGNQSGMFGNLARAVTSPQFAQFAQSMKTPQGRLQAYGQQPGMFGNLAQAAGGVAGSLQGPMSTMGQYFQSNTPTPTSQPMNPSQQSQVPMQSPDGQHFQYVNAEHVPHYQGLGATIANGSSYGSSSGGY